MLAHFIVSYSVVLGSVAKIPADSCEEIKLSEHGNAVSDYYWIDPDRSGNAAQVYCVMEGKK